MASCISYAAYDNIGIKLIKELKIVQDEMKEEISYVAVYFCQLMQIAACYWKMYSLKRTTSRILNITLGIHLSNKEFTFKNVYSLENHPGHIMYCIWYTCTVYDINYFCHTIDFGIQYLVANFTPQSLTNSITSSGDNCCKITFLLDCHVLRLLRNSSVFPRLLFNDAIKKSPDNNFGMISISSTESKENLES